MTKKGGSSTRGNTHRRRGGVQPRGKGSSHRSAFRDDGRPESAIDVIEGVESSREEDDNEGDSRVTIDVPVAMWVGTSYLHMYIFSMLLIKGFRPL